MSSPARPSRVSTGLLGGAGAVGVFLLAAIIMLIVDEKPFVGNPLFTAGVGATIIMASIGMQLRCRDQLAAIAATRRPILVADSLTAEIRHRRPTVYRSTAEVAVIDEAAALRDIEAEMKGWIARDMEPPAGDPQP